jgi:hypothetical protein
VIASEVPAATLAAVGRTWEAILEAKYPGTRWHVHPRETAPANAPQPEGVTT